MRDLLYKNLTSNDRKRRIIASSEIVDKQGVHSVIRRHFICLLREVEGSPVDRPKPYLYVLKERNTNNRREKFFCKIKGSIYAVSGGKLYLILFMHTLCISLNSISKTAVMGDSDKC
ncbi:MAG: hypothetical protein C4533_02390 [Candidatus Omnitrophota bacterium]|jgi:hypothetical protein|nr:MAG: hypothetical protein C4533_02390 [Candidatus Omnitrophota bacterium]